MLKQAERIKNNVQASQDGTRTSRYGKIGLTLNRVKLSSKNFDKLMQQRGLSDTERSALKASVAKGTQMQARHARAGEMFVTTHGTERSSGVFVSDGSLGKTPSERIDKGALPHSNTANYETKVALSKNQDLIYSKIAPQSKFSKMDPKQAPRTGGGEQVITDGGYKSGAVINKDPKYPIPAKNAFLERANEYKGNKTKANSTTKTNANMNSKIKGQTM